MSNNPRQVMCLLFEGGYPVNLKVQSSQHLGESSLRYHSVRDCDYKRICPFYQQHRECPSWDEIKSKYLLSN